MMTSLIGNRMGNNRRQRRAAFTLLELILVMALLVVVASLVTPTLAKFFTGRALDSEVRRFVALTHFAQNRAVSEGVPMQLWIDSRNGSYGLNQDKSYGDNDPKAVVCQLSEGLKIDTMKTRATTVLAKSQTGRILNGQVGQAAGKLPMICFSPDGTIRTSLSVAGVSFQDGVEQPVWLGPTANDLGYEIQDQNKITTNARH